jgi:uncharacterized membrane protein SpoIIM required for sporulation
MDSGTKNVSLSSHLFANLNLYVTIISLILWSFSFWLGIQIRENEKFVNRKIDYNEKKIEIIDKSTIDYFKNNIIVYNLIVIGFFTFGLSSALILSFNAIIIGYFFENCFLTTGELSKALSLIVPHSFEYIGFIIGFILSIQIAILFFKKGFTILNISTSKKVIITYLLGMLMVLLGAYMEANITILFL